MRHKKNYDRLISSLLTSESISQAAEKAGMSRQHVHRLMRSPDFRAALRQARSIAHGHAMSRLCELASQAVTVLELTLNGGTVNKTQFLAARAVLELSFVHGAAVQG